MAADVALKVVKQIQSLADGPKTQEMRDCLGHVVSSLQLFLDHPDSQVRLTSARAMSKLASGYAEDFKKLDLAKAKATCDRCARAVDSGNAEHDVLDLHQLLSATLRNSDLDLGPAATIPVEALPKRNGPADRGEVILKMSKSCENSAAILEAMVKVQGVVSATVEGIHVVVSTRIPQVASDSAFLKDVIGAVEAHVNGQKVEIVARPAEDESEPQYLDGDEEDEVFFGVDVPTHASGTGPGFGLGGGLHGGFGRGVGGGGGGMGGPDEPQFSFFSRSNWMTGRKAQEFQDNPAIVARLAKAKKKEDERMQENKTLTNRLSAWYGRR